MTAKKKTQPQADNDAAKRSLSMHENVEAWDDCCSCEAEPYWVEAFGDQRVQMENKGQQKKADKRQPARSRAK